MANDSEMQHTMLSRRKINNLSSSDDKNNYEKTNISNSRDECDSDFDTEVSTLDPSVTEELKYITEKLSHEAQLSTLKEIGAKTPILPSEIGTDLNFKRKIVWSNAIGFLFLHIAASIGVGMSLFGYAKALTNLYTFILIFGSGLGITMGAHRMWAHRAYKAKAPLRVFLLFLQTLASQNCLYIWVRDHRQHHKYSDTDADPHNASRGFFFSHIGWLMSKKHPKVIEYGKKIDMSDLEADKWIMFQKDHYKLLYIVFALVLPVAIPIYAWGEDPIVALFVAFFSRVVLFLNATWSLNSAAHAYGTRPFDKSILPVENMFLGFLTIGEGWHNYHHAFPWDYRASEFGTLNITGFLIDILANLGLIYDRKEASHNMIKNRAMRAGDNSHKAYGTDEGRRAIKTLFNLWEHPLNPTYNSIYSPKLKIINSEGYALAPDELSKNELDEDLLSHENKELKEKQHRLSQCDVIE